MTAGAAMPWRVVHVDLAAGPLPGPPGGPALVVLWWRDLPVGEIGPAELPGPGASRLPGAGRGAHRRQWEQLVARAVAPAVAARLRPEAVPRWLPGHYRPPGPDSRVSAPLGAVLQALDDLAVVSVPPGPDANDVSVVVCTRDRPASLARTLAALAAQRCPPGEVVVVENGPPTAATRALVERFTGGRDTGGRDSGERDAGGSPGTAVIAGLRHVYEARPGLSVARNTGLRHARGGIVAFTDDDAEPHPAWAGRLASAFAAAGPEVLAVTGLVLPATLESEAARLFEFRMGGFSQGTMPLDFDPAWFRAASRRGVPAWKVGAGADMAFRREAFALVGGFDERLGAGAAGCSEDSELWYRLVAAGATCRYEPAAVVYHHHRPDLGGLRSQAEAYLEGHVAALFVSYARHRRPGELVRAFVHLPAFLASRAARARFGRGFRGDPLIGAELRGYRRGLRHARLALRATPPPDVTAPAPAPPGGPARSRAVPGRGTGGRAARRAFLAANPFPHPYTEGFFFREKMRAIHRVAPAGPVGRVLEVGGGGSTLTAGLYPGARVVSVDIDPSYGRLPALAASGARFAQADAVCLPFADGSFDVVTFFDVLEHVPDDAAALAEARRVLRDGGTLLVSAPNERWRFPYHRPLASLCPPEDEVMAGWGHVRRGYALDRLDRLVGTRHHRAATFISPVTSVAHDLSFSRLPARARRWLIAGLSPVTWAAYALHRPGGPGTETAAAWALRRGPDR